MKSQVNKLNFKLEAKPRPLETAKIESFGTTVNSWQPLLIVAKLSTAGYSSEMECLSIISEGA